MILLIIISEHEFILYAYSMIVSYLFTKSTVAVREYNGHVL